MSQIIEMSDYDYELPEELIAQEPPERGKARMLIAPPGPVGAPLTHGHVGDLVDLLRPRDVLVVNDTRVIPARLRGVFPTGGRFEILLLEQVSGNEDSCLWEAMVRPGRKLQPGLRLDLGPLHAEVETVRPDGTRLLRFSMGSRDFLEHLHGLGETPLPPYIRRPVRQEDEARYQTVYAREDGAVAAPTAGLHLTEEILQKLAAKGVDTVRTTLHVGAGTFLPVKEENALEHAMHEERYHLSEAAAARLEQARAEGGRIIAVGTTSLRTLETVWRAHHAFVPESGRTHVYIHPYAPPESIQGILTNFHWPRSTLVLLVAAWLGSRDRWREVYECAIRERYHFYSYGDCMISLRD